MLAMMPATYRLWLRRGSTRCSTTRRSSRRSCRAGCHQFELAQDEHGGVIHHRMVPDDRLEVAVRLRHRCSTTDVAY